MKKLFKRKGYHRPIRFNKDKEKLEEGVIYYNIKSTLNQLYPKPPKRIPRRYKQRSKKLNIPTMITVIDVEDTLSPLPPDFIKLTDSDMEEYKENNNDDNDYIDKEDVLDYLDDINEINYNY